MSRDIIVFNRVFGDRPTMIDQLKAETSADDEELMIFLGIGTAAPSSSQRSKMIPKY